MVTMLSAKIAWNFSRIPKGKYHNRIASKFQNTQKLQKITGLYWAYS